MNAEILDEIAAMYKSLQEQGKSWPKLSESVKLKHLSEIASRVSTGYVQQSLDISEKQNVAASAALLPQGNRASFDNGRIIFNIIETFPHSDLCFYAAVHEAIHHGQNQVAALAKPGLSRETDLMRSATISSGLRYTLNLPVNGRTYVQHPKPPYERFTDRALRTAFYRSSFLERQSHSEEIKIVEKLGGSSDEIKARLEKDLAVLRDRYNCHHLTDAEVYELIDRAQEHVANGTTPKNALEASVTYDMAALMYEQDVRLYNKNPETHIMRCRTLFNPITKAAHLAKLGFEYTMTIPMSQLDKYSLHAIKAMGQDVRDQNPHLMVHAIAKYGTEAAEMINIDSFDRWYEANKDHIDIAITSRVAGVLGEKYRVVSHDISNDGQEIGDGDPNIGNRQ